MFVWMSLTVISFAFLHWGRHLIQPEKSTSKPTQNDNTSDSSTDEFSPLNTQILSEKDERTSLTRYCVLLGCLAFICAQMNGVVPNVQSYAALSYTPVSCLVSEIRFRGILINIRIYKLLFQLTYHLSLALGNLAQAVACFLPLWIQPRSVPILTLLTVIASSICGYLVLLAAQSPTPLLLHSYWGGFLSVIASIMAAALHAYLRTVFTSVIREDNPDSESRLFWCGVFMQVRCYLLYFF